MLLVVDEDLFPNELAKSAVGDQPFAKKNVLICIFAALSLTALFATLIAVFEYLFGAVADSRELAFYDEFHYLGVLPTSEEMFSTAERKTVVFNTLFHNFLVVNPQVVFTGALTGARIIPQFFDFLKWNFSMEGKRMLTIEMVQAEHFDAAEAPDDESLGTMIVTFADGKCYLPVASKKYLVPAELELLKNDFRILREHYDYIFIKNSFPLRRSKLFLEQVASICNAALYAVGAGKTPRKNLRELVSVQQKLNIPIMTILSENTAGKLNKDLMREEQK